MKSKNNREKTNRQNTNRQNTNRLNTNRQNNKIKSKKRLNYSSLICKIIAIIVMMAGITVMLGWIFDVPVLKSIIPTWVSMKFITALSFVTCGFLIYLFTLKIENEYLEYISVVVSFTLILLMMVFFVSVLTGISTSIENLFVKEAPGAVKTAGLGVPAIPTMACFILIGLSQLIFLLDNKRKRGLLWIGIPVMILGMVALVGYIVDRPALYYTWEGFTSMAANTAILFTLIGLSLILLGKNDEIIDNYNN